MVHGTLPSYSIYVYEVSSNHFHLLKSYAVDNEYIRSTVSTYEKFNLDLHLILQT